MTFADIKAKARRDVHGTLAVRCLYKPPGNTAVREVTSRLHTKVVVGGAEQPGYATIIEGVTKAVFNREDLALAGIVLRRGGQVSFPDWNVTYTLDTRDSYDGAVTEKWTLASL